jgi:hypothetical protein
MVDCIGRGGSDGARFNPVIVRAVMTTSFASLVETRFPNPLLLPTVCAFNDDAGDVPTAVRVAEV